MPLYFCDKTRYVVLLLTIAGLTLMMSNSLVFNFTNICMIEPTNASRDATNQTGTFTSFETNTILAGTAVGCFLGAVPITYITTQFGSRLMFTIYGMLGGVSMLITPFVFQFGFYAMLLMRVFQGAPIAATFVSMAAITSEWSPLKSTGLFLSWMSCNIQFGSMFTMPVSGYLCESRFGWRSVYYLHGALSIVIFLLFFYFFRDSPRDQSNVSETELAIIEKGKFVYDEAEKRNVPYRKMLTDPIIWTILLSIFAGLFGLQLFMQYGAIYLNKTLKMDVKRTGWSAALPFALSCLVKFVAGPLSDYAVCLSEKARIIIFASISQFLMAACFITLALLPSTSSGLIQLCFTLVIVFSGLNAVGVLKATQEVARHFSHVIMAWVTFLTSGIIFILPVAISIIVPNYAPAEWSQLFMYTAILAIVANLIFVFTIDVRPRRWAAKTAAPAEGDTGVTTANTAVNMPTDANTPIHTPADASSKKESERGALKISLTSEAQ